MPPDASDPLVKPKSTSTHHHEIIRPSQDWGFWSFFYPDAKTYVPPDAGDSLVKPKGTRTHHHGRIRPTFFFGFFLWLGVPHP